MAKYYQIIFSSINHTRETIANTETDIKLATFINEMTSKDLL